MYQQQNIYVRMFITNNEYHQFLTRGRYVELEHSIGLFRDVHDTDINLNPFSTKCSFHLTIMYVVLDI